MIKELRLVLLGHQLALTILVSQGLLAFFLSYGADSVTAPLKDFLQVLIDLNPVKVLVKFLRLTYILQGLLVLVPCINLV